MANIKITDLPELTGTPNDANLLEIVDKASETPTSKKITWATIKAAVLTAVEKVNGAVGFTLAGGTTSKTLTVEDTSLVNQDLTTDASPTFANITDSGLDASQMVFTDANKKLVSRVTYEVDALYSYGSGTSFTKATIDSALTAIGTTNNTTLLLRPGTWVIDADADYSAYTNVTFKIVPGAVLQIATGTTTTIAKAEIGLYKAFDCVGTGRVVFGTGVRVAHPEWWGFAATATDEINAASLQAVIDSGVAEIKLPRGRFPYSTGLTINRALRFDGASNINDHIITTGASLTQLVYSGAGIGIALDGVDESGRYNIHLSNFSLYGNVNATGGILVGTSATKPIIMSSIKNVNVDSFTKPGQYGIQILRCQQSVFENVYARGNYDNWYFPLGASNTTLTFINCTATSALSMGWRIQGLLGSSFYQCLAESNTDYGLFIHGSSSYGLNFYNWHDESNGAANTLSGNGEDGSPTYINFWGGYFGTVIGGTTTWSIDYANSCSFHNIDLSAPSYMTVTDHTVMCVFETTNSAMVGASITGNAVGRMNLIVPTYPV